LTTQFNYQDLKPQDNTGTLSDQQKETVPVVAFEAVVVVCSILNDEEIYDTNLMEGLDPTT
jgi:hypothetical protein